MGPPLLVNIEDKALWHLIGRPKKKKKKIFTDFACFESYSADDFYTSSLYYVFDICMMQKWESPNTAH